MSFKSLFLLGFAALLILGGCHHLMSRAETSRAGSAAAASPNIILVLTDDMAASDLAFMPAVNSELVDKGISFSNYFVTDSLCCPSRTSILRGQYVHSHNVTSNAPPNGGFQKFMELGEENCTLANWVKGAGYRTALFGKFLNLYPKSTYAQYVPPDWDSWASPLTIGGYAGYHYRINANGTIIRHADAPEDYITDVLAGYAKNFIDQSLDDQVPFFLYLAPYAPHAPATPAPRHAGKFKNLDLPRPPNFNEADVTGKPAFVNGRPPMNEKSIATIADLYHRRLESLQAVDEMVAAIVAQLERRGAIDSTYIFFSSDNGFHLGQHRLGAGKKTAYEEDIHVPLIVRGPGVPASATSDALAVETDIGPTIADLAGATPPDFVEGRSLTPFIDQSATPDLEWRKLVLIEHFNDSAEPYEPVVDHAGTPPPYSALRTVRNLYVRYETGEREMYDLSKDPYELENLAARMPAQESAAFDAALDQMSHCSGAQCRDADRVLPAW